MIAVAAVFGLLAVFVAQSWLNSQAEARLKSLEAQKVKPTATSTLVVASRALRFGNDLLHPCPVPVTPWAPHELDLMLVKGASGQAGIDQDVDELPDLLPLGGKHVGAEMQVLAFPAGSRIAHR